MIPVINFSDCKFHIFSLSPFSLTRLVKPLSGLQFSVKFLLVFT